MTDPCDKCKYQPQCGYAGEEDQCPKRRREMALSYPLHGDERDGAALELVREVMTAESVRTAGQMRLM